MTGLDSDELGDLGESEFRRICASTRLICNKSDRDRTGWDFMVQFPLTEDLPGSLEARSPRPACFFQVKTKKGRKSSVSCRLTSLERLAKEPTPTFIYALEVDSKDKPVSAFLIHLLDEPLAVILKRLRHEDTAGKGAPNRKRLSLSVTKYGVRLAPTGEALREALESIFQQQGSGYIAKKLDQLENIGFEERRHHGRFRMEFHPQEIVDVFLGLKTNVRVTEFSASEVRFGIPKESIPLVQEGFLTIRPHPVDGATVSIRGVDEVPDSVLRGQVFIPAAPGIPREYFKTVIDLGALKLVVGNEEVEISIEDFKSPTTPAAWAMYWRFLWAVQTGKAVLEIVMDKMPNWPIQIPIPTGDCFPNLSQEECRFWAQLSDMAVEVLRYVGAQESRILLDELLRNRHAIGAVYCISRSLCPDGFISFNMPPESRDQITGPAELLYVDNFQIGDTSIAFYGLCTLKFRQVDEKTQAYANDVVIKRAIYLINPTLDYDRFVREGMRATGRDQVWVRPLPESPLPSEQSPRPRG